MFSFDSVVLKNDRLSNDIFMLKLAQSGISKAIDPGQFIHVKIPNFEKSVLRRPFSVYDVNISSDEITILYRVIGEGTCALSKLTHGVICNLIGPIGHGWDYEHVSKCLIVGGGLGAAPLYMLAKNCNQAGISTDCILGATTAADLVYKDDFESLGLSNTYFSTDDGTCGYRCFCTDLVKEVMEKASKSNRAYDLVFCCGPEIVMNKVSKLAKEYNIDCQVSLERRMACGIGACLSCSVETIQGIKRCCIDGPIFNASEIVW